MDITTHVSALATSASDFDRAGDFDIFVVCGVGDTHGVVRWRSLATGDVLSHKLLLICANTLHVFGALALRHQ